MKWFCKVLNQYADFKGRACREEFWMFALINLLVTIAITAAGYGIMLATAKNGALLLPVLYTIAVLVPSLAVTVRRLHDTGRTTWFLLANLIPLIGGIWMLIVLIPKGMTEDNHYGKNPAITKPTYYHRKRSASVALIFASVFWLLSLVLLFVYENSEDYYVLLSFLLAVGLFQTGAILFTQRVFSASVAWILILLSTLWLYMDIYIVYIEYSRLLTSFDLPLVISMLKILVPIGLLLSGLFILLKITDKTIPACILFVGALIWILSLLIDFFHYTVIEPSKVFSAHCTLLITVPVSLMVLARTLLSKEKSTPVQKVEFLRHDKDNNKNVWMVYKASSKTDAMAFLSKQVVDRPSYYIIVETPEGNFGRDIDGIYQE